MNAAITRKRFLDPCNIYIILWVLGRLQGLFFQSSLLSMLLFIPYALMTVYYIYRAVSSYNLKGAIKALSVFFAVMLLYGIALLIFNDALGQDRKSFLMMLLVSLGPVFPFYVFSRQGLLTEERIQGWFFVLLAVATVDYIKTGQDTLQRALEEGKSVEEITNNSAYMIAGLIPMLFALKKRPLLQYLSLIIILYFVITGMKRGAILVAACLLIWFVWIKLTNAKRGKRIFVILCFAILIWIGTRFVLNFYEQSDYFQYRVEQTMEGSSSSRNQVYTTLWNHWINNGNPIQFLFGEGAYHTENVTGYLKAHNDWLELLIDCGLIGALFYFVYWICFVVDCRRSRYDTTLLAILTACFIFNFLRTFFSMSFSDMPFYICIAMGYGFGQLPHTHNLTTRDQYENTYCRRFRTS